ncbi:MAG: hypothetical protein FWH48_06690 [Oscillospiraceae bacterium]|nr:hypothetical protein [Oscillospiraceae bacterium]
MILILSILCVGISIISMGAFGESAILNFFVCILGISAAVFHIVTHKRTNLGLRAGKYGLIVLAALLLAFVQTGKNGFFWLNAKLDYLDSAIEEENIESANEQIDSLTKEYGYRFPGLIARQFQLYSLEGNWGELYWGTIYWDAQNIPAGENMIYYSAVISASLQESYNINEAKTCALEAVSLFPWNYEAQYLAGITNFYFSDYDLAESYFINATALDSKAEEPFYALGWISYLRRDAEAAEYYFVEALSRTKDPEHINAIYEMIAFAKSGEWYDGIDDEVSITDVNYSGDGANISLLSSAKIVPLRNRVGRGSGRGPVIIDIPQKPKPKSPQKKDTRAPLHQLPPVKKERPPYWDDPEYWNEALDHALELKWTLDKAQAEWRKSGRTESASSIFLTKFFEARRLWSEKIEKSRERAMKRLQTQPPTNVENVEKPNIYFYGTEGTQIAVSFERPDLLTNSIPDYGDGWTITQGPNGAIYDAFGEAHGYLFYESIADTFTFNKTKGFALRGAVTEKERARDFRDILKLYGFNEAEICDFIEYWGSRLDLDKAYHMYPQTEKIDEAMPLVIAPTPDTVYRIWFGFAPASEDDLPPECPEIVPIVREGFTVIEWGGYVLD